MRVIKSSCPALEEELVGLFEASGSVNSHYAVVFGVVCCWLGIARDVAAALFMKIFLRDLVSAAVRLNIIGPMEGTALQFQYKDLTVALMQRVLSSAATAASAAAAAAATHESDASPLFVGGIEPQQVAPILEVAQGRHDLLYTRLFNS